MKKITISMLLFLSILITTACSSKPEIVDNGNPGSIQVTVYNDSNANGARDPGESGVVDKVAVGQDVSCPIQQRPGEVQTNASGETTFSDLKPGVWCVMHMGGGRVTTKLTEQVYLSSDQVAHVSFGVQMDEDE